ncbi:hypothetical protein CI088_09920 [Enterococcus plantarum]|uniref:Lipoprotein n=1 Tax=Enterococcus plantarum TaxID=1077675 RepID=A0A2W3ZFJ5_9ENTE|nr:hypothetical protein [Enterococcus plantarum]PZL72804.1 hypothetical protein CI088_09920 [Enterococcus plantarum]
MSKNKKIIGMIVCSFVLTIALAGCTKPERYEQFSKTDQSLSWTNKRERSFGDSDYSNLKTEDEAFDLLKDKYQLSIPTYYEDTKKLVNQMIPTKNIKAGENKYSVFARNKKLEFKTIYPFYKEKELELFAEVNLNYEYSVDQKQAYLQSQIIKITISKVKGKLPKDNLSELIRELGKNMKLPEKAIVSGVAGYEKRVKEAVEPITEDYLPVVSNSSGLKKNEEFLKEIAVVYDQEGTVREIYAEISEQRE